MVRPLGERTQDLRLPARVKGCIGYDLLEEVTSHKS